MTPLRLEKKRSEIWGRNVDLKQAFVSHVKIYVLMSVYSTFFAQMRGSIVVSISACHAEDPGSIPGRGVAACTKEQFSD